MANHIHRQIREAIASAVTGLASTGSNVYVNRLYAIPPASLPALRIAIDSETVDALSIHQPLMLSRTLQISIECCAQGGDTLDDTCDQMSKEVETALSAGFSLGGLTRIPILTASGYDDDPAGLDTAVKRLEFTLTVETLNTAPDALI